MYYCLNPYIGLRSFILVPYCYYIKGDRNAKGLSKEEFEILKMCDSLHDIEYTLTLQKLVEQGFARSCEKGTTPFDPWQYKECDNRYFPAAIWEITNRCNYNCKHCFNAVDNNTSNDIFTLDEAKDLIKQMADCGINAITLTGGEPMLHPDFFDIVFEIMKQGMYVEELNTNGFYINKAALIKLQMIHADPLMKISFDGLGYHNWMRGNPNAEETAINAIKLCVENNFRVKIQTNVWKGNLDSILKTAEYFDSLGVNEMRIIKTTEVPRWKQNADGQSLGFEEYYDEMLKFIEGYLKKDHKMVIDIWQLVRIYPQRKSFDVKPVTLKEGEYRDSVPVCRGNRGMVAIGANGHVYPCLQISGKYEELNIQLGNVRKQSLHDLLKESRYLSEVCTTIGDLKEVNEKCANCKYFKYCAGGCRALSYVYYDKYLREDPWKCIFYEKGYYDKLVKVLKNYKNNTPINID